MKKLIGIALLFAVIVLPAFDTAYAQLPGGKIQAEMLKGNAALSTSNPLPVAGTAASGATAAGAPLRVGAKNGTLAQDLLTNSAGNLYVSTEGQKATYGVVGAQITPAATTTDIVTLVGSATKTVVVKRVIVSGLATTAGSMDVSLVKRTTANSGGTATQPSIAQYDSSDAAPTAVVNQYSANPTLGTGVALKNQLLNFGLTGSTGQALFEFSTRNDKPLILRGVAQSLAINLNGQAVPSGGKLSYTVEWEEF